MKFLAIAANNLDEFFMVRVATLARQCRTGHESLTPDGLTARQELPMVRARAEAMLRSIASCWNDTLRPLLAEQEIRLLEPADYTPEVHAFLADYFSPAASVRC